MNPGTLPVCRVAELAVLEEHARWLVEPLWGRTAVGFVGGAPKLGKTWLALDLALSVATGSPCLGRFPVAEAGGVLVYLAEDHPTQVRHRLAGLCRHRGLALDDLAVHVITAPALRLDLAHDRDRLSATVAALRPRLLVLDPLVRLHRRDENHSAEVAELLAYLRDLERAHDLAILVVHHLRKHGAGRAGQALRGSGDLHAWTDSALYLTAKPDRVLLTVEHRAAPAPAPFAMRLVAGRDGAAVHLEVVEPDPARESPPADAPPLLTARLLDHLAAAPRPLARCELRRALRVNNQRLGDALADLEHRGQVRRDGTGAWVVPDPPSCTAPAPPRT